MAKPNIFRRSWNAIVLWVQLRRPINNGDASWFYDDDDKPEAFREDDD